MLQANRKSLPLSAEPIIARRVEFAAAHLYRQAQFSDEENRRHFGRCFTPHGHGHNYVLEVFMQGRIDPDTRLVMNLADLDRILKAVIEPLDHHHLNHDVPEFRDLVPTTENIALHCRREILKRLEKFPGVRLKRLRLFESDDLWVEVTE